MLVEGWADSCFGLGREDTDSMKGFINIHAHLAYGVIFSYHAHAAACLFNPFISLCSYMRVVMSVWGLVALSPDEALTFYFLGVYVRGLSFFVFLKKMGSCPSEGLSVPS